MMAIVDDFKQVQISETEDVYKLLVIGDSGVGKSCLVTRFTKNCFSPDHFNTIGVDFRLQKIEIDGREINLQIWDSAGYERFRIMTSSYYKGAHGIIMAYDVTNKESFDHLNTWLKEVQLYAPDTAKIVVVGNKCDLISERSVSFHMAENFSQVFRLSSHFEVSARTGKNVDQVFFSISSSIARRRKYSQNWIDKSLIPHSKKEIPEESNSFEIYEMIRKVEPVRSRRSTKVQEIPRTRFRKSTVTSDGSKRGIKTTGCCFCCQII